MRTIRPATAADYEAFARMFPELKTPDPTPSAATWERDLVPTTAIVEEDGAVCGYCYVQTLAEAGYVRHLVVAPEGRGKGLGRVHERAVRFDWSLVDRLPPKSGADGRELSREEHAAYE
ncbi:MAG: GNAT family N-acetyltransferase, partial [Polyangiaceae bacterium]|nr:GNAT family N-acetyltransferase [Polyangiaceae bacterium]